MLRSSLFAASAFAFVATAGAQQTPQVDSYEKITGPVKNGGIYHVATGTWTRTPGSTANLGPDTIHTNTADSGYYSTSGGVGSATFTGASSVTEEGGLPGLSNQNVAGNRDFYEVNGFQIGYCDFDPGQGVAGWDMSFYDDYLPCSDPAAITAKGSLTVSGLPSNGCWIVTLDLEGTTDEFCLEADGGAAAPGFDNDEDLDSFGWGFQYAGTGAGPAGFILKGDPRGTDPGYVYTPPGPSPGAGALTPTAGVNTYFGPAGLCGGMPGDPTTGYLNQDSNRVDDFNDPNNSGCYYFGGYSNISGPGFCGSSRPFGGRHIEIYASAMPCGDDGIGMPYGPPAVPNSTGNPGDLVAEGSASVADDNVQLICSNLPNASFGFLLTSMTQNQVNQPPGSVGILLLGGNIGRFVGPGQIQNTGNNGSFMLDTNTGVWSLNAIPSATGPYMAMAGQTTSFQGWHRDSDGMGGAVSNFTNGYEVTWTP